MGKKGEAFSNRDYYKLGINISNLRKAYRETQENLADAVGVTKNAISNYESGERIPQRDELRAIAKHYGLTVSQLLAGDYERLSFPLDLCVGDPETKAYIIGHVLPIIYTDEAMENENFNEAYNMHISLFEAICSEDSVPSAARLEKVISLYEKAAEDGITEAYGNLIWWPAYIIIGLSVAYHGIGPKTTFKEVLSAGLERFSKNIDASYAQLLGCEVLELKDECLGEILKYIYWLKNSNDSDLCDLAEYYIALGYLYGFLNKKIDSAESRMVGQEMLRIGYILKNPYVTNFITALDNFEDE